MGPRPPTSEQGSSWLINKITNFFQCPPRSRSNSLNLDQLIAELPLPPAESSELPSQGPSQRPAEEPAVGRLLDFSTEPAPSSDPLKMKTLTPTRYATPHQERTSSRIWAWFHGKRMTTSRSTDGSTMTLPSRPLPKGKSYASIEEIEQLCIIKMEINKNDVYKRGQIGQNCPSCKIRIPKFIGNDCYHQALCRYCNFKMLRDRIRELNGTWENPFVAKCPVCGEGVTAFYRYYLETECSKDQLTTIKSTLKEYSMVDLTGGMDNLGFEKSRTSETSKSSKSSKPSKPSERSKSSRK